MSRDEALASIADEIDALAERLADHAIELLSDAVRGRDAAERTERVVTRARRSLTKAAALLRGSGGEQGAG